MKLCLALLEKLAKCSVLKGIYYKDGSSGNSICLCCQINKQSHGSLCQGRAIFDIDIDHLRVTKDHSLGSSSIEGNHEETMFRHQYKELVERVSKCSCGYTISLNSSLNMPWLLVGMQICVKIVQNWPKERRKGFTCRRKINAILKLFDD